MGLSFVKCWPLIFDILPTCNNRSGFDILFIKISHPSKNNKNNINSFTTKKQRIKFLSANF